MEVSLSCLRCYTLYALLQQEIEKKTEREKTGTLTIKIGANSQGADFRISPFFFSLLRERECSYGNGTLVVLLLFLAEFVYYLLSVKDPTTIPLPSLCTFIFMDIGIEVSRFYPPPRKKETGWYSTCDRRRAHWPFITKTKGRHKVAWISDSGEGEGGDRCGEY